MIKINIKLFGTLPKRIESYDAREGVLIELENGSRVIDLMNVLDMKENSGVVVKDGIVLKTDEALIDGTSVSVFQSAAGG
ncbi:hypothetical protein ACFL2O_07990 [Thermodesulfobacteriota bacterium]